MGLLTPQPKKKGLLGGFDPFGLGNGLPLPNGGAPFPMDGRTQPYTTPMGATIDIDPNVGAPKKAGFFGEGGVGRSIAGTLGDTLATWAGGQATYAPMMQRRQAIEQEQRVHDRDLQDSIARFRAEQDYKRANPTLEPHYWETNDGSLGYVGTDGKPSILYKDPTPKINWIEADDGRGGKRLIPVGPNGPLSGGGNATPPATLPPDFDFDAAPTSDLGVPPDAVSPGGSTPTVLSRADAAPFMKSLGPVGFQRWMAKHNIRLGN